jgi:hypothetical protein
MQVGRPSNPRSLIEAASFCSAQSPVHRACRMNLRESDIMRMLARTLIERPYGAELRGGRRVEIYNTRRKTMKMKLPAAALFVLLTGCGSTTADREATGGLLGLGLGVLAAGPIGGIVGAGVGLAGGAVAPESVDVTGKRIVARNLPASVKPPPPPTTPTPARLPASQASVSTQLVMKAQEHLSKDGLYSSRTDGIVGPKTRQAILSYQQHENLPRTGTLDDETLAKMKLIPPQATPSPPSPRATPEPDERNEQESLIWHTVRQRPSGHADHR